MSEPMTPGALRVLSELAEQSGLALVPLHLDADMRRAIWEAWAARHIETEAHRERAAATRLSHIGQLAEDVANWAAIIGEAKRRFEAP